MKGKKPPGRKAAPTRRGELAAIARSASTPEERARLIGGGSYDPHIFAGSNATGREGDSFSERMADYAHKIRLGVESAKFESALAAFRADGNALNAIEALSWWRPELPLPEDLFSYLRRACEDVRKISAKFAFFGSEEPTLAKASADFLRAFGIDSNGRKSGNAFAALAVASKNYKAVVAFGENTWAYPKAKAEHIVQEMAVSAKISVSAMRKHIQGGAPDVGGKARKRDIRSK